MKWKIAAHYTIQKNVDYMDSAAINFFVLRKYIFRLFKLTLVI